MRIPGLAFDTEKTRISTRTSHLMPVRSDLFVLPEATPKHQIFARYAPGFESRVFCVLLTLSAAIRKDFLDPWLPSGTFAQPVASLNVTIWWTAKGRIISGPSRAKTLLGLQTFSACKRYHRRPIIHMN